MIQADEPIPGGAYPCYPRGAAGAKDAAQAVPASLHIEIDLARLIVRVEVFASLPAAADAEGQAQAPAPETSTRVEVSPGMEESAAPGMEATHRRRFRPAASEN